MPFSRDPEQRNSRHNFVLGEQSLRAYLAGGNVRFLEDAEASFDAISRNDQRYDTARFYLGITKTQLRKTNESIPIFEELRRRTPLSASSSDLADKIALQLAYAHIKTYTDAGYEAAETQLQELENSANVNGNRALLAQSQASGQAKAVAQAAGSEDDFCNPAQRWMTAQPRSLPMEAAKIVVA